MKECPHCHHKFFYRAPEYSEKWDAFWCSSCFEWLEDRCCEVETPDCPYRCWERPEHPSLEDD